MRAIFLATSALLIAACDTGNDLEKVEIDMTPVEYEVEQPSGTLTLADIADPVLSVETVRPELDVFFGPGGNIGVLYGVNGVLLVDDKFEANADEILARVAAREGTARGFPGATPTYVLNTHYHGDHSGSNAAMKAAGATIVAHEETLDLMSRNIENQLFGRTVEARDPADLPDRALDTDTELNFAGQTTRIIHLPAAHTSGDLMIHFTGSDVIHMGDTFFNGMNPYIDIDAGGSLQGVIDAQKTGVDTASEATVIIPGHGPLTDRAGLLASHDQLVQIRDLMQARIDAGDTLDEVLAADIYNGIGVDDGFIDNANLARIAYRSLTE